MTPATEVVLLTLTPNADYSLITKSAQILARQPGCLAVRTSRLHQELDKVHYFIDWDSVDSHLAFARNKDVYVPFRELVGSVMAGYAPPYHVSPSPCLSAVFDGDEMRNGVVMVGKAWFPGGAEFTSEQMEDVAEAFRTFTKALGDRGFAGFTGHVAGGWSLEDGIPYKGRKSRVFIYAVRWQSTETYLRFRDSEDFRTISSSIAGSGGLRELEICLVNTRDIDATT
ncbi:hypothetical protein GGR58DRAFT_469452 [Xylaria digitata]|nr:hypothetical protein GGR58DRAFT_469452 [Xylaria digitata]